MPGFDPNMDIALRVARGLAREPLELPAELADVNTRATFILAIDKPLLFDGDGVAQWVEFGAQLSAIAQLSADVMPELATELERISVALVLWAGCILAVKAIALETRSGANTIAGRAEAFATIDKLAVEDPLFRAGVEAAPAFKTHRLQPYSLDGVPEGSPVRRHLKPSPG
jgi:hypothetical protein